MRLLSSKFKKQTANIAIRMSLIDSWLLMIVKPTPLLRYTQDIVVSINVHPVLLSVYISTYNEGIIMSQSLLVAGNCCHI